MGIVMRGPNENRQYDISKWADETFGPASSNARVAARANEEMAELLRALTADDNHPKAAEEVADVVIILFRLMTRMGADLGAEIDRKMEINRARQWNLTADGHGYHVREKQQPAFTERPVSGKSFPETGKEIPTAACPSDSLSEDVGMGESK